MRIDKYFVIIITGLSFMSSMEGQSNKEIFRKGINSLCNDDTTSFLAAMNQCSNTKMDSDLVVSALIELAGFYKAHENPHRAIGLLHSALNRFSKVESIQYYQTDTCTLFLEYVDWKYLITRGGILKEMSKNYFILNMHDSAIIALNKINIYSDLNTIGCLSDVIIQGSEVAYLKAKAYLGLHDTISAIDQLLDYCLHADGNGYEMSHQLLKRILFDTYGKTYVLNEIERSLKSAKLVKTLMKSGVTNFEIDFYLFGRKMPYLYYNDIDYFKEYVVRQSDFVRLLEEE
ncbi:MAG: hypothetical protein R3A50_16040 [Saprospiraceae bacterium]